MASGAMSQCCSKRCIAKPHFPEPSSRLLKRPRLGDEGGVVARAFRLVRLAELLADASPPPRPARPVPGHRPYLPAAPDRGPPPDGPGCG